MIDLTFLLSPTFILVVVITLLGVILYRSTLLPSGFPPGPPRTPLFGNLILIKKNYSRRHETLTDLSETYGAIFGLKYGTHPVVVLNDYDVIKEAFVDKSDCFGRPEMLPGFNKLLSKDGRKRGIIQNGDTWWTNRLFTGTAVKNSGVGSRSNEDRIHEEINAFCTVIKNQLNTPSTLSDITEMSGYNILSAIFFGSRFDYKDKNFSNFLTSASFYINPASVSSIVNFFPKLMIFLGKNWLSEVLNKVDEADEFIENKIKEHEKDFKPGKIRDFIDYYLNENQKRKGGDGIIPVADIVRCMMDCFGGGTSTIAALDWMLLYIAAYPAIQDKCYQEINKVITNERKPMLSDKENMPFISATINEALRLTTPAPFGVPFATLKNTTLDKYTIPKNTLVVPNLYAVLRNENYWQNASEFCPGRWIDTDGNLKQYKAFIPFGIGKRQCLGKQLALDELFLFLSTLIMEFRFEVFNPDNLNLFQGEFALTLNPQKYKLIIKSR